MVVGYSATGATNAQRVGRLGNQISESSSDCRLKRKLMSDEWAEKSDRNI
jgi:hypothetical protein